MRKRDSWPYIRRRSQVLQFRSRNSRCQASSRSAGASWLATCAARSPTERSATASSRVSRTNSDNDFPRSAARASRAERNSTPVRTVIVTPTYESCLHRGNSPSSTGSSLPRNSTRACSQGQTCRSRPFWLLSTSGLQNNRQRAKRHLARSATRRNKRAVWPGSRSYLRRTAHRASLRSIGRSMGVKFPRRLPAFLIHRSLATVNPQNNVY